MKEGKDVQTDWHFFYNKNENRKSKFLSQKGKRIENIKKESYSIDQLSPFTYPEPVIRPSRVFVEAKSHSIQNVVLFARQSGW